MLFSLQDVYIARKTVDNSMIQVVYVGYINKDVLEGPHFLTFIGINSVFMIMYIVIHLKDSLKSI